ncbi:MarR family transcriptional regulator [Kitasatospora sp. MAP5-34]|uniref:MarR family winged helix-turn-helix transcriptional regulator n=1 Tax=Kitasatospora sp. MAP5-34 TaxID=3035102 RepID=UPI00247365FD|nr:MarR family transcriptional regulator [Kitasatospora sp. MAP5-34]MDH6579538.1 DNA-binding MarR family transcriptional regulator [Kitasatospora sp. MAP5-34]
MPKSPNELTGEVISLFAAVNRRYAQESEAAAATHELTPLQAKALLATEDPVPMRRIADRLHAEPSNVTAIIDRLESRGLVGRSPDPGDRRVKLVAATAAGRTVIADLRARMPFAAAPLDRLTTHQRESLRELLQLMLDT